MVIQDSSKDYYRQTSNNRISQYSLLARSSNIPIALANMSVNDFYANMHGNPTPSVQMQMQIVAAPISAVKVIPSLKNV